ncbi:MAG: PEP/pyruvate-binding domain-containing protein [Myxococcales bacterium]
MASETNTPPARRGSGFIVPVEAAGSRQHFAGDVEIEMGGKARSLVRLAELGLPVPPAFAVGATLWRVLRLGGPPLPEKLANAGDLSALEVACQALQVAPWPPGFIQELDAALASLARASLERDGVARRFSVRSSADVEDRVGGLAAGLYVSRLAVERAEVPAAMREVLTSFLTPAAWAYATAGTRRTGAPDPSSNAGEVRHGDGYGGVLIHPFIEGACWGTAAGEAAPSGAEQGEQGRPAIRVEAREGAPTTLARARIEQAVRAAVRVHGPVEIEWVASGDSVVFLQMRSYQPAPALTSASSDGGAARNTGQPGGSTPLPLALVPVPPPGAEWTWDAAHNPAPLSPAQAGLVELVDELCRLPFRQRVVGGYLFWARDKSDGLIRAGSLRLAPRKWGEQDTRPLGRRPEGEGTALQPGADPSPLSSPRSAGRGQTAPVWRKIGLGARPTGDPATDRIDCAGLLEELRQTVEAAVDELGAAPALEAALAVFVGAYEPLFGLIGPACAAARAALTDFLQRRLPSFLPRLPLLLAEVPSVATRRRDAVQSMIDADTPARRQAALADYLRHFGDESPRWDVSEPTLREGPQRLVLLMASRSRTRGAGATPPLQQPRFDTVRKEAEASLPPDQRSRFDELLAAAREAVAVGEDDDALFALLQATVRRALLAVGDRLVVAGELDVRDDVFYLPLAVTRAAALPTATANVETINISKGPSRSSLGRDDLRRLARQGRQAALEAARTRPLVATPSSGSLVRGQGGAGGRMIGRAVHHPHPHPHPIWAPLGEQSVLIADTLLPTELPLLTPGAVVVETGHVLGHVAAQARERGIPAVVGAAGARAAIPEGTLVLVDGDRGEVLILGD